MIDVWYGDVQTFGFNGLCQRWVNVLGRVELADGSRLAYRLNGSPLRAVSLGPDGHRLARRGDFNVEIDSAEMLEGQNLLVLSAEGPDGRREQREVTLMFSPPRPVALPLTVCWGRAARISDVAQIVDGCWALTPDGVRVLEPYYDRVIGIGDLNWTDYEISTTVCFHGLREPCAQKGDGGAGVIHAALAVRWPGHDMDDRQPHVKWYPLGATAEFRVNSAWRDCRWRILGGGGVRVESNDGRSIDLGRWYGMRVQVKTLPDGRARYRARLWPADEAEGGSWDLEMTRPAGGVACGGALLIAHYTDVTFGDVRVVAV
jgi:hypothetical protein